MRQATFTHNTPFSIQNHSYNKKISPTDDCIPRDEMRSLLFTDGEMRLLLDDEPLIAKPAITRRRTA